MEMLAGSGSIPGWLRVRSTSRLVPALVGTLALVVAAMALRPALAVAAVDTASRSALLIGNADYGFGTLKNPLNDVRAMDSALRELDFKVQRVEDADHTQLLQTIQQEVRRFPKNGVGLFYYAGHAVQHRGRNYLLPVDFDPDNFAELPSAAVSLDSILETLEAAEIGLSIIILDACRDYPFGDASDAFGNGLAEVASSGEALIAYATAAGATAYDGVGANSPYTASLVSVLEEPGLEIYGVFRKVRGQVREATGGLQRPWISGSLETALVLRAPSTEPEPIVVAENTNSVDEILWKTIRSSQDPTDYEMFLEAQPTSPFAGEALQRLASITEPAIPPLRNLNRQAFEIGVSQDGKPIIVTECDLAASGPSDPMRVAPGVHAFLVNIRYAIRACALAVSEDPDNPRLNTRWGRSLFLAHRYEAARPYYEKAMAAAYPSAYEALAKMHRQGLGVREDARRAFELYQEGALRGVPSAKDSLAAMYKEGWGVAQSAELSLYWRELAAGDNFAPAFDALSSIYRKGTFGVQDATKAFEYAHLGAQLGDSNAMMNLGRIYLDGEGVPADQASGVQWLTEATERGNVFAPYHLANLHLRGEVVAKDPVEALELLQLSADRGFEWALYRLGRYYERGDGGEVDLDEAYYYFSLAVAAGELGTAGGSPELVREAEAKLSQLALQMSPGTIVQTEQRAQDWIKRNGLGAFETSRFY
jgi:TPR repeat protein